MNLKADYDAVDADVQMSSPEEGMLLFLLAGGDGGWVG